MGILKRNVSAKSNRSAVTIIAQGNRFHGETSVAGKMHVDGVFEGGIDSSDDISIGRQGRISGRVRAQVVHVSGELEGELICDSLHIERGGQVRANVCCTRLSIDPEGIFVGERRLPGQSLLTWDAEVERLESVTESEADEAIDLDVIESLPDRITLSRD